jgi:hypothetical protein
MGTAFGPSVKVGRDQDAVLRLLCFSSHGRRGVAVSAILRRSFTIVSIAKMSDKDYLPNVGNVVVLRIAR